MIPLASVTAKRLGKRISKVVTEAQDKSGDLNKYLIDIFKNHKIIKIFQREKFEEKRSEKIIGSSLEAEVDLELNDELYNKFKVTDKFN